MIGKEAAEAAQASMHAYHRIGRRISMQTPKPVALDIGAGIDGWGTTLLRLALDQRQRKIALFDPHRTPSTHPRDHSLIVVDEPAQQLPHVDWLNFAYVFSHIPQEQILPTLESYRTFFPRAIATVLDYTLRGRDEEESFFLLTQSRAEEDELLGMDSRVFLQQHMRFSLEGIHEILQKAGYNVEELKHLDRQGSRGFALGTPL